MMILKKTAADLDATDFEIMNIMQENARITMRELAQQIALSPSSTAERVRRLEESGFIQGYHAELDPAKLGYTTHAMILVAKLRPEQVRPFYRYLQDIPQIVSVQNCIPAATSPCWRCTAAALRSWTRSRPIWWIAATPTRPLWSARLIKKSRPASI